jgi:hypothetical protein
MGLTLSLVLVLLDFPALSVKPTSTNVTLIPASTAGFVWTHSTRFLALVTLAFLVPFVKPISMNAAPILARTAQRVSTA